MVSIYAACMVILYLVVGGVIFWLLTWLVDYCGIPDPFRKVARVILAVLAVFVVIGILLQTLGGVQVFRP